MHQPPALWLVPTVKFFPGGVKFGIFTFGRDVQSLVVCCCLLDLDLTGEISAGDVDRTDVVPPRIYVNYIICLEGTVVVAQNQPPPPPGIVLSTGALCTSALVL